MTRALVARSTTGTAATWRALAAVSAVIRGFGEQTTRCFLEFFGATIRNKKTREGIVTPPCTCGPSGAPLAKSMKKGQLQWVAVVITCQPATGRRAPANRQTANCKSKVFDSLIRALANTIRFWGTVTA